VGAVELFMMNQLGTSFRQAFVFLGAGEDERHGGFRAQHLARVWVVREDADDTSIRPGGFAGGMQDGAMAEVHAIEGADGEME
jgi:hypothetical protein